MLEEVGEQRIQLPAAGRLSSGLGSREGVGVWVGGGEAIVVAASCSVLCAGSFPPLPRLQRTVEHL